jgi:chromosome segregation ATPase
MAYHRRLKECHTTTQTNLESLKVEHESIVNELHSSKSKLQSPYNKLERADDIEMDLEVLMLDIEKDRLKLEDVESKLSTTSVKLVSVTQKYESAELNYQQATHRLASSLTQLKDELDAHNGTQQELADAATKLILIRSEIIDAAIDIDEARKQVFERSAKLLAANDDISILEGLYKRRDFQEMMEAETNQGRSLFQNLNSWANGTCKWKRIAEELFRLQALSPHIINHSVTHNHNTIYTSKSMARVMDLHHGFNISGIDAFCHVEPNHMGEKRLLRSSSSVKCVF